MCLTAAYLADNTEFRSEFLSEWNPQTYGLDIAIQPIDAPRFISAGSWVRVKAFSYDGEYGLSNSISRP